MNVNTPGNGEPLDGQILKFRFDRAIRQTRRVLQTRIPLMRLTVSLFLNNTDHH